MYYRVLIKFEDIIQKYTNCLKKEILFTKLWYSKIEGHRQKLIKKQTNRFLFHIKLLKKSYVEKDNPPHLVLVNVGMSADYNVQYQLNHFENNYAHVLPGMCSSYSRL